MILDIKDSRRQKKNRRDPQHDPRNSLLACNLPVENLICDDRKKHKCSEQQKILQKTVRDIQAVEPHIFTEIKRTRERIICNKPDQADAYREHYLKQNIYG